MGAFERKILLADYIDENKIKTKYDSGPEVEGEKITVE